jgi:hypothetical protein
MEMLQSAFDSVSTVSSYILVAVLIPTGLYFTIRTGAVQVRLLPEMFRTLTEPGGRDSEGNRNISPFRAFSISAASRVGNGEHRRCRLSDLARWSGCDVLDVADGPSSAAPRPSPSLPSASCTSSRTARTSAAVLPTTSSTG